MRNASASTEPGRAGVSHGTRQRCPDRCRRRQSLRTQQGLDGECALHPADPHGDEQGHRDGDVGRPHEQPEPVRHEADPHHDHVQHGQHGRGHDDGHELPPLRPGGSAHPQRHQQEIGREQHDLDGDPDVRDPGVDGEVVDQLRPPRRPVRPRVPSAGPSQRVRQVQGRDDDDAEPEHADLQTGLQPLLRPPQQQEQEQQAVERLQDQGGELPRPCRRVAQTVAGDHERNTQHDDAVARLARLAEGDHARCHDDQDGHHVGDPVERLEAGPGNKLAGHAEQRRPHGAAPRPPGPALHAPVSLTSPRMTPPRSRTIGRSHRERQDRPPLLPGDQGRFWGSRKFSGSRSAHGHDGGFDRCQRSNRTARWPGGAPSRSGGCRAAAARAGPLPGAAAARRHVARAASATTGGRPRGADRHLDVVLMVSAAEWPGPRRRSTALRRRRRGRRRAAPGLHLFLRGRAGRDLHPRPRPLRDRAAHRASGMAWTFLRDNLYADFFAALAGEDGVLRGPAGDGRVAAVARTTSRTPQQPCWLEPRQHTRRDLPHSPGRNR